MLNTDRENIRQIGGENNTKSDDTIFEYGGI